MKRVSTVVLGRAVRVAREGTGPPLLLIHGGWGGAELHWKPVWSRLVGRHEVVAPDLPGLGTPGQVPLGTVAAYAHWLVALLDALALREVVCVGNSFGATVAWAFAGRHPDRCAGLVLVNGFPMPATPAPLAWLAGLPGARSLAIRVVRRSIFSERSLLRAFDDPERIPDRLRRASREEWPLTLPRFVDIAVAGDGSPPPATPPVLIWGRSDRLPGTSAKAAERRRARMPGATLHFIDDAGHFPQLEAPGAFAEALEAALDSPAAPIGGR